MYIYVRNSFTFDIINKVTAHSQMLMLPNGSNKIAAKQQEQNRQKKKKLLRKTVRKIIGNNLQEKLIKEIAKRRFTKYKLINEKTNQTV